MAKPLNVLHVTVDLAGASGVVTFVKGLVAALAARGVAGRIYTQADAELPPDGTFDLVHIHGLWLPIYHRMSGWAHRRGIPVVWSPHGTTAPWAMRHKRWKKIVPWHLYQKRDLRAAAAIHCTSEQEMDWNRAYGLNRLFCIPIGCAEPAPVPRRAAGREHVLLYVGRLYSVKALDRLIRAFGLVPADVRAGWRLRLVGPDEEGCLATLRPLAEGLPVDFAGPRYGAELAAEYAACDALALVSHSENFGATVVDAMACGKPVVTSTKTPWRIVQECGCGWWTGNDPAVLSAALRELMALSDMARAEMGVRGRELVTERFTWSAVAAQMEERYRALV